MMYYLYPCFAEQLAGKFWIKWSWHGEDWQVLGADTPVLPGHVGVQAVARLSHGATQHTSSKKNAHFKRI